MGTKCNENPLNLPKEEDVQSFDFGDMTVNLVTITPENRAGLLEVVLSTYANEPCRICGKIITRKDVDESVWAGYSKDNSSGCAHKKCWDKNLPVEDWAIQ